MKQSVELNGTPQARKRFIIESIIFLYASLRLVFTAFMIRNQFETNPNIPYEVERDDPFTHYFKENSHIYDESMPLMLLVMGFFNYICLYHLYRFDAKKRVWESWYQLLVTNRDDYYQFKLKDHNLIIMAKANQIGNQIRKYKISSLVPYFIINGLAHFYARWKVQTTFEHIDREQFFAKKLTHLPNLPHKIRIRIVNVLIIGDYAAFWTQLLIAASINIFYTYCGFQMDTSRQAWYAYIHINIDAQFFVYIAIELVQNSAFFTMLTYIGTIIYTGHIFDGIKSIWNLIYKCRRNSKHSKPFIPFRYRKIVDDQLHDYNRVTSLVIRGSSGLFGTILYSFLMTNIPINILLLRRNVFENQTMFEKSLAWMVIFLQLIAMFIVLTFLSWSCAVCHKPSKFIPILQPMLKDPRKWLWYKIKYEDLYMRLVDDGPKIGIAIGPVQTVTYRSSLEVLYKVVKSLLLANIYIFLITTRHYFFTLVTS